VFVGRQPGAYKGREAPIRVGTHLGPDAFLRRFKRLCKRAGITGPDGQPLRIHDLRHTFAYLGRVVHKAAQKALMKQGGWRTHSAFDRYGIGDDDEIAMMYDEIDQSIERETERIARRRR
jgi:integrase